MPHWYKEKGYHTSIFSGNATLAEANAELCLDRHFNHWGVMKYLREEFFKATPVILEDFEGMIREKIVDEEGKLYSPLFSVLWLFDTHYPYSNGKRNNS